MHLAVVILGLTACTLGSDPAFPGGGSAWSTDDSGSADDSGEVVGDGSPVIDGVDYDWEDYPNSESGWLLNVYITYTDAEDDLEGGQAMLWLGEQQLTLMIDSDASTREAVIDDDGRVFFALDTDQDDYEFQVKLKDAAGNGSEKVDFSVAP